MIIWILKKDVFETKFFPIFHIFSKNMKYLWNNKYFFYNYCFKKKQRTEWYSRKKIKKFDERYKHSLPATVCILITGNYPNRARCHRRRAQWWYHITVVFLFSAWTSFIKLAENYLHPWTNRANMMRKLPPEI